MLDSPADDPLVGDVVIGAAEIQQRVEALGKEITEDYAGRTPLLVCVLKGAYVFLTDLARAIDLPVEIDFIAATSYGSSTRTSGVVRLVKDLDQDISGRDVILVEDIVDSGLTLRYLKRNLMARSPKTLAVAALLARETANVERLGVSYVGFSVPPDFLIGYGLDLDQRYRNLPFLARYDGPVDRDT
ncbi:MAG TPA: hypoxanthine phosphoribosyltransferase [Microthrixaceae bacterium]|nr:hypoxanthine phosphoribosyltransferase [Microthrixaceae bacterium]